jgi:hypothetical protein
MVAVLCNLTAVEWIAMKIYMGEFHKNCGSV